MDPAEPGADTTLARLPAPRPGSADAAADRGPRPSPDAAPEPAPDDRANQPSDPAPRPVEAAEPSLEPVPEAPGPRAPGLRPRERAVLDFELRRWRHAGAKEEAIRAAFELSPTRYFQILNALLDDPAALAYQPTLVTRLRRIRDARRAARD